MTDLAGTSAIPTAADIAEVVVVEGTGCFLIDTAGRRYLDFTSGVGVTSTGHGHPRVVAAVQAGHHPGRPHHGQGIASGLPLGAVAVKANAAAQWKNGGADSTFRANPLACAAALATLQTIEAEQSASDAAVAPSHISR